MIRKFQAFFADESAATAIEYALIAGGISIVIVAAVGSADATWNIQSGCTLDFQAPCVVNPGKVIVNGNGNNVYGSLRMDACNQQGNVLLNGPNCQIGDGNTPPGASTISGVISRS